MIDFKYMDKKFQASYDLDLKLFNKFGIKVSDIYPVRKVYYISSNKGDKILKKVEYTLEELKFFNEILEYISIKFNRILKFCETVDGTIYQPFKGNTYCLYESLPGVECQFNNPIHLQILSKSLGELHNAGKGFKTKNKTKNNIGKLINNQKKKLNEMKFFKSLIYKYDETTEFDEIAKKEINYFINQGERSIEALINTSYNDLCNMEDKICICHHDLAYHNILINDEKAYFIDFDYAIVDLKVHDLCNLINKVEKQFSYDIEILKLILNNYNKTNNISKEEMEVLKALLIFPQDFYGICSDYYTRKKNWEEEIFVNRLTNKILLKEDRENFLNEF